MRVAVVGGTGLVGRHTTNALRQAGHDAVVVARSTGVDVTNFATDDAAAAQEFFAASTRHLLAAGQRAGVGHHVVLSIVGIDRIEGNAHYAGKRRQEELAMAGPIPVTILRATQFHEFTGVGPADPELAERSVQRRGGRRGPAARTRGTTRADHFRRLACR